MTSAEPRPGRRRERIGGVIIALVGVAVLVLSIVALRDATSKNSSDVGSGKITLPQDSASSSASPTTSGSGSPTASGPSTGTTSTTTSTGTTSTAGRLPIVVLNNTTRINLAQQAAAIFTQGGWTVTDTGNLRQDVVSTCAYYDPSVSGSEQAAEALMAQFPAIKRVKAKFGALPAGPIVVVLTTDYSA